MPLFFTHVWYQNIPFSYLETGWWSCYLFSVFHFVFIHLQEKCFVSQAYCFHSQFALYVHTYTCVCVYNPYFEPSNLTKITRSWILRGLSNKQRHVVHRFLLILTSGHLIGSQCLMGSLWYSQTCLQWSATGNNKSGLCWQVTVVQEHRYTVNAFDYVAVSA